MHLFSGELWRARAARFSLLFSTVFLGCEHEQSAAHAGDLIGPRQGHAQPHEQITESTDRVAKLVSRSGAWSGPFNVYRAF
jgi:hypothetical protein